MQKILKIVCLSFCCLSALPVFAQRRVTGNVFGSKNETLTGVTVKLKESENIATFTDNNGHYELSLPDDGKEYTMEVSFIGYMTKSSKINPAQSEKKDFYLNEKEVDLGTVVVTATRTPKLLKNSPIITKVISASEIKKIDATHIGDLLQSELPGVEFSYTMNQQVVLNMQGFGGNSVLFLVDGERLAGETMENIDYNRLNLDNVERVEIIKGVASTLYGSSAVGGVVNIITKEPSEPWQLNLNTRFSAHKEQRHGGSVGFKAGKFSSLTNVQRTSVDGFKMKHDGVYPEVMGLETWNFKENLRYQVNDKLYFTGRAGYFFKERDPYLDQIKDPLLNLRDRYRSFSGGLKGNYAINKKNNFELAYSFDQYDKSKYIVASDLDTLNYRNVQNSLRALYNHSFDSLNVLTIGGDLVRDYLTTYQFEKDKSHRQYTNDLFVQLDLKPLDKFSLITGLRYDYFSQSKLTNFSTSIASMYRVGNCALRASYAGGFRAPSLKEMYMKFFMGQLFYIYGNPDLKPEVSQNFTLSAEYTNSNYNFSISGYYNKVQDRITTIPSQEPKGQIYANIENVTLSGLDVNGSVRYPCGFGMRLSYIYAYEDIKSGPILKSSMRPHTATAQIEYGKSWKNYGFNIMLNGRILSSVTAEEYDDAVQGTTITSHYPAYSMWNLSLLQNIWKGIDVTLAVDNLFDYVPSYYYSSSPYTTGATFSVGVSLDIDKLFK